MENLRVAGGYELLDVELNLGSLEVQEELDCWAISLAPNNQLLTPYFNNVSSFFL